MFFLNKKISFARVLRYFFSIVLVLWFILGSLVFYNYIRNSAQEVVNKGGTFVEGIFKTTSYLPYLSNDPQSLFYQGLLFRSCLKYDIDDNHNIIYDNDLCKVDTNDHQTYYVSLMKEDTRSDGVPISLDDIYFTYKNIIVENPFGIKYLNEYSNLKVTKETNRIKIAFPQKHRDNNLFFTNYILPEHALKSPNIDMYQQSFALEPVYNKCAKIYSQSTDQYSLVFDLTQCKDTHIGFYQIKRIQDFATFEQIIKKDENSFIDAYDNNPVLTGYLKEDLYTDKYMMVFFNTKSPKFLVRTRRALGGLLNYEIKKARDIKYFSVYNEDLFSTHYSTGEDIKSFLDSAINHQDISLKSIKDSGINPLPEKITIQGTNQVYSHYTDTDEKRKLSFSIDQKYDKIGIVYDQDPIYYTKSYQKEKKTFTYGISPLYNNLKKGLNKYTIYGFVKKKKIKLASIKLYLLNKDDKQNLSSLTKQFKKAKVIYYNSPINNYTVTIFKKIIAKHHISDFFIFEGFDDQSKIEGVLSNGQYDILIGSLNPNLKKNYYTFLSTEQAVLNPSQYMNSKLINLLNQYTNNKNTTILNEINSNYANDMPFVILGKENKSLAIRPNIREKITTDTLLHEYNWRKTIYKDLVLTKNIYIDPRKGGFSFENFYSYITN